jgi:hypothetical protein
MRMTDLQRGWPVVGNDGRRVGTVEDVGQNYVVTSQPRGAPLYVPASAIANVLNETVHLSVTQRDAGAMGWEQPPRGDDELQTSPEADLDRHV